jgi:ribosomal protein S18 acetylase RimI-like enzyme
VITSPRTQAQGTGRWLMEQVFERCGDRNLSLNSTDAAYHLYLSLGFTKEATVFQWQGEVVAPGPVLPVLDGELRLSSAEDLDEIAALDGRAVGINRHRLLDLLAKDASICTLERGGKIVGYSMNREFGRGRVIGPIIASNDLDAIHLTAVHLKDLTGQFARVDTREQTGSFAGFLQQSRLGMSVTVTTMSKGRRFLNRQGNEPWVYGLAGHALT